MHLLVAFAYPWMVWHTPLLLPFSIIDNTSTSAQWSNFTFVFFKTACYTNPGAVKKQVRSS